MSEQAGQSDQAGQDLSTDFQLMGSVATAIDSQSDELRAMLQAFIGRMAGVPPSVWGGSAAARFQAVLDRWHTESLHLHRSLHEIAVTIRANERALRAASHQHAVRVAAAAKDL